ncbi:MAG: hypothetical protein JOZ96_17440 [Acidobacteria bacterium]|nr:hypothetical protein [Acidobacteriota bacterium]
MIQNRRASPTLRVLCALAVAFASGFGTAAAQAPEPKTVADFFLLVPERYMLGYDLRFREEMLRGEHRGVVVDIENGYISYDASDNPTGFEFAIFRKNNGRYIVAYSNGVSDNFDDDDYTFLLLSYEGGRWRDVTKELLPVPYNKKHGYMLPRRGRDVRVLDDKGRKFYTLTWRNDRFHLKRTARR